MLGFLRRILPVPKRTPVTLTATRSYEWEREWDRIGVTPVGIIKAKYDAAQTTPENRRHWANADGLSANAANDPVTRRILRNRSRYEVANNAHACNLLLALANYTVGTGPRLQVTTDNKDLNRFIEREFTRWMLAIDLAGKLRTMRMAKCCDGETFAVLTNRQTASPVALDLRLIEADHVTSAPMAVMDPRNIDGVILDEFGVPVSYEILSNHPGDRGVLLQSTQQVPAKFVLHYLRQDRPGQARGVPELTPALPLFALLRRYILAVLTASESAASFAAVLKTVMPPAGDEQGNGVGSAVSIEPGLSIEIERNTLTSLPEGWDISQLKAEQPTAVADRFIDKIVGIIGCVVGMPFNVISCNSSGYNYASGRLDYQSYDLALKIERSHIEQQILERLFRAWLDEAALVEGYLPQQARKLDVFFEHQWFWDGREHVDPLKEATAQEVRLRNGTSNLAHEYAKTGRDYETETAQWANELGLRMGQLLKAGFTREEALQIVAPRQIAVSVNEQEAP